MRVKAIAAVAGFAALLSVLPSGAAGQTWNGYEIVSDSTDHPTTYHFCLPGMLQGFYQRISLGTSPIHDTKTVTASAAAPRVVLDSMSATNTPCSGILGFSETYSEEHEYSIGLTASLSVTGAGDLQAFIAAAISVEVAVQASTQWQWAWSTTIAGTVSTNVLPDERRTFTIYADQYSASAEREVFYKGTCAKPGSPSTPHVSWVVSDDDLVGSGSGWNQENIDIVLTAVKLGNCGGGGGEVPE